MFLSDLFHIKSARFRPAWIIFIQFFLNFLSRAFWLRFVSRGFLLVQNEKIFAFDVLKLHRSGRSYPIINVYSSRNKPKNGVIL